jgi:hypothetical protein
MKLSNFVVVALLPFAALGAPAAEPAAAAVAEAVADAAPTLGTFVEERGLSSEPIEKRSVSAVVKVDGLRSRKCPRTSCTAVGQYKKGTRIRLVCYTRKNTTTVNKDK